MEQQTLNASNVKCAGCVKAIRDGLGGLPGVREVTVEQSTGVVTVHGHKLQRELLAAKLAELGYPEIA